MREYSVLQFNDPVFLCMQVFHVHVCRTKIHVGDGFRDKEVILNKENLIKCTVPLSKSLYHRVLQFRYNKNLLYFYAGRAQSNANFRPNAYTNRQRKSLELQRGSLTRFG
jgi:hypothetical protein